jgi:hypothetical protein
VKQRILVTMLLAGLIGATSAQAANIIPVNNDPAGQGLNDPTARAPEGGNPGTSVGQQRRIAYQFAADLWGSVLKSTVDIRVGASFKEKSCAASSGVLGSAGPWNINSDFPNAPLAGTWYHAALADSLAGVNLNAMNADYVPPDDLEINSSFNAYLGGTNPGTDPAAGNAPGSPCLTGSGWYYGLDGNTPANRISFLDVVMHEIGHGLGFSGFVNKSTGNFDYGQTDVYSHFAYDNQSNKTFDDPAMTNALRAQTMKTPGRLVWSGTQVNTQAPSFLAPGTVLRVTAPAAVARDYEFGSADFGPAATPANFNGQLLLANDGSTAGLGGTVTDGCQAFPAGFFTGKIALIYRGVCGFAVKTKNAQDAGATAVLIANNRVGGAFGMTGTDATISIATLSVSQNDGTSLAANLPVTIGLLSAPGLLQGADSSGRVRLYAPEVVANGSTFSHYDSKLTPNALMEPAINDSLAANYDLDLTPALFKDEGWGQVTGNAMLGTCDTTVPVLNGGLVIGANVQADSKLCVTLAAGNRSTYLRCINDHLAQMQRDGVITSTQLFKARTCASYVRP